MKKVQLGSQILVEFDFGEKETFQIVNSGEGDVASAKVSSDTPFGKAVIGEPEGEKITYLNSSLEPVFCQIIKVN